MQEIDKENSLINLLANLETSDKIVPKIIIFVARKNDCDLLNKKIKKLGYDAEALHGDKTQAEREKNLELFRRGKGNMYVYYYIPIKNTCVYIHNIHIYIYKLGAI
jgi:superfamily II DNA/RNA helicase